jgi:polygalacturonase
MEQHSNLNSLMGTRDHFKNGVSLKSHMSRVTFRITKTVSKMGKMAMIAIMAMFTANIANAQISTNSQQANQQSIKTVYTSKDWVISDFVVTDPRFGAKAGPGFDNRAAFQAAIDAAYNNGGGVVLSPSRKGVRVYYPREILTFLMLIRAF